MEVVARISNIKIPHSNHAMSLIVDGKYCKENECGILVLCDYVFLINSSIFCTGISVILCEGAGLL